MCVCVLERERSALKEHKLEQSEKKTNKLKIYFLHDFGKKEGGGTDGSFYNLVQNLMHEVKVIFDRIVKFATNILFMSYDD